MKIQDLPPEVVQHVTKQLAALNAGNATAVCNDLKAWCRAHPVACRDPTVWRAAFEALFIPSLPPAPPSPPPAPPVPIRSDYGLPGQAHPNELKPKPPCIFGRDSSSEYEEPSDEDEEERDRWRRWYEATKNYRAAKAEYDKVAQPAQEYADKVKAANAARAALDAKPPASSYKDAFVDVCARIDWVKVGNYKAIRGVHPALLRSECFISSVAVIDARVIYYGSGFDREDDEAMLCQAIEANPRNMRHAMIYSYGNPGNLSEENAQEILADGHPEILQHMPEHYELSPFDWNLEEYLEENPLWLEHMRDLEFTDDKPLMLKLAKTDGRSLQFMANHFRGDKRIVLAALEQAGAVAFEWVMGAALRRDPDVRESAGLKPFPGAEKVAYTSDCECEEEECITNSDDDDNMSEEE